MSGISLEELNAIISDDELRLDSADKLLWRTVRIKPAKWTQHPWGDPLGGFWAVGILGQQVIWFNEIEDGFNVSSYAEYGNIAQYWCNDDELQYAMRKLLVELETGRMPDKCGPPQPINDS